MAIIYADNNNFNESIANGLVLVDFYADWCGPCRMIAPELEKLDMEMPNVQIVKLNVDNVPQIAQEYGVMSIPTLILFNNGKQVAQTLGFKPKEQLRSWIESYI